MANTFQKIIYNLSSITPLCFTFSLVWWIQEKTYMIPLIFLMIGIGLSILLMKSFFYGLKSLAPIQLRTSDIAPNDGWIIAYIISYMLPFANMVIDEWNLLICSCVAFLFIIIAPIVNTAIPNPLLFLLGYHFYTVGAENGISGYVLISKRKLRRKQDLKIVNRMFDFLLIDRERR